MVPLNINFRRDIWNNKSELTVDELFELVKDVRITYNIEFIGSWLDTVDTKKE